MRQCFMSYRFMLYSVAVFVIVMTVALLIKPKFLTRVNDDGDRKINTISLISFSLLLSILTYIIMYVLRMPRSSRPLSMKPSIEQPLIVKEEPIPSMSFN